MDKLLHRGTIPGVEHEPDIKQLGRYVQLGILGSGTYGLVIRARDTSDPDARDVAIKLLPRGGFVKEYRRYVMREVMHHGGLKHPFIIDLKACGAEVFLTPEYLAIVMEYAQGGNLHRFLRERCLHNRLTEDQARWIFQQMIVGLDFCHRMGVANRDLKLENLLLDQDQASGNPMLKICDFGYSKHDLSSTANTRLGTPVYMAPEDLPPGALGMNDWYMDNADSLQDRLELVQTIVETASAAGHEGEPMLQCFF
ncbi:hypothetical protein ABPG75_005432 [Micractinium tetrahymenae]